MLVEDTETLAVQFNGKLRGTLTQLKGTDIATTTNTVLAMDVISTQLAGRKPDKVIVVPGRIANVVIQNPK
jgi:leucyl-tRNA synthetase